MKDIAMLINERKRKLESIQRVLEWQCTVDDWQVSELVALVNRWVGESGSPTLAAVTRCVNGLKSKSDVMDLPGIVSSDNNRVHSGCNGPVVQPNCKD